MTNYKQLVFVDDSGDPGFKLDRGSTSYFVIACVIFDDALAAKEADIAIKRTKNKLGLSGSYEFKFNGTKKKYIKEVLSAVKDLNFRVRAMWVDKTKMDGSKLANHPRAFYNYAIKHVLLHSPNLFGASVKLDGRDDKSCEAETRSYLRKKVNSEEYKISKVTFSDSKKSALIQLADLVAGSIHRYLRTEKTDFDEYLSILKKAGRIESICRFP
jgi:hypothetical protein